MDIVFDSKFFDIRKVGQDGAKIHYVIMNKPDANAVLGYINWFPRWRKYVFTPNTEETIVFDESCLEEIIKFLKTLKGK